MQAVKIGWVGPTFALARCSDTGGKRRRSRKMKEERKTMVESFIERYRKSNNGNFPSLNLTQKEVGGSFYTIREIVREVIQENKVLGPGNSASQILYLEDSEDQISVDSFSLETVSNLSLAINGHATEEGQKEECYSIDEHQIIDEDVIISPGKLSVSGCNVANEGRSHETFSYLTNETIFPQQMDGLFADESELPTATVYASSDAILHVYSDTEIDIENSIEMSGSSSEVSDYKLSTEVSETASLSSDSDAILLLESGIDMEIESSNEVSSSSVGVSGSEFAESDISKMMKVETMEMVGDSDKLEEHSSSIQLGDDQEVLPISYKTGSSDGKYLEKEGFPASSKETEGCLHVKKNIDFTHVKSHSIDNGSEKARDHISSVSVKKEATSPKTPVSNLSNLPTIEIENIKAESLSSEDIHKRDASVIHIAAYEQLRPPSESVELEVQDEVKSSNKTMRIGKSLIVDSVDSDESENSTKQQTAQEPNPFWTAMKGFFAAFIKFWTE